jgi:hypothetical protein
LRPKLEIGLAILTGVLFVAFGIASNASKVAFAIPCIALWGAYATWRVLRGERKRLGLTFEGFWSASIVPGLMVLGIVAIAIARRAWLGWTSPPRETWLLLLIYPPWGLVQQMLVQVFVAQNVSVLGVPRAVVIVLGALLFGAVHAPDWTLVAITTFSGLIWTWCFLRRPTLIPIALAHGWSGAFMYTWILDRSALH